LLVDHGSIAVHEVADQKLLRRVLFMTAGGGPHIYGSGAQPESLFDAAFFVVSNYKAVEAINLEGGDYGLCVLIQDRKERVIAMPRPGVIPSNVLVIDF
jgi:hypothetical protein